MQSHNDKTLLTGSRFVGLRDAETLPCDRCGRDRVNRFEKRKTDLCIDCLATEREWGSEDSAPIPEYSVASVEAFDRELDRAVEEALASKSRGVLVEWRGPCWTITVTGRVAHGMVKERRLP